jgi:hypothetical protein
VEPLTDPVGWGPRLGARMVDVLHNKGQFILVARQCPTGLPAAVGGGSGSAESRAAQSMMVGHNR